MQRYDFMSNRVSFSNRLGGSIHRPSPQGLSVAPIKKLKKEIPQKASESKSKPSKKKESRTVYLTEEQRPSLLTLLKDIVIQGT